jgi:hypothetical protein
MFLTRRTKCSETKSSLRGKTWLSAIAEFRLDDAGERIAGHKTENRNDIDHVKYHVSADVPAGHAAE